MGVMLLIFTPLPYVDASSSWAFASKWQRAVVGMAGMLVELFLAAIAAVVWAQTNEGTLTHTIAYNIVFASGISTLLFNANPLLRYDGYYILSDLLEIPNLWQRSREYMYYIVKKYIWGVKRVRNPAQTEGEKFWMIAHGIASTIYRAFVVTAILLYVASVFQVVGLLLATAAVAAWVLVPVGKFLHYLLANQELMRCRTRALVTTGSFFLAVGIVVGSIHMPQHVKATGEVKQKSGQTLYRAEVDGFLTSYLPTGSVVELGNTGQVLVQMENPELNSQRQMAEYEVARLEAQMRDAVDKGEYSAAHGLDEQIKAVKKQIATLDQEIGRLMIKAAHEGQWLAHPLDRMIGGFLHRGDVIGMLVGQKEPQIEVRVLQEDASYVLCDACTGVELRLPGDPGRTFHGQVAGNVPAGQKDPHENDRSGQPGQGANDGPSVNRTRYGAPRGGGPAQGQGQGQEEEDAYFQVFIRPGADAPTLYAGQAVAVRFDLPDQTLASQWYHSLLQLLQKRFKY
jgi:putative peptide zinc metalloprotease protein